MIRRLSALSPVVLLTACGHGAPPAKPPLPLVSAYTVISAQTSPLELRGSLSAARRIHLGFKQGGVIAALSVEEGAHVSRDQIVGQLDDIDARSATRAAQAAHDKARRDAERAERLAIQGAMPSSLRDDARNQLDAAASQLAAARDAVERTRLRAPFSGTVFKRLAEPGETVGSGNPVLIIDSTDRMVARAGVTESERARLSVGMRASLRLENRSEIEGRVSTLATTPNPTDGLYVVEVEPRSPVKQPLLPGALVEMRFEDAAQAAVIRIPLESLVHRQERDFVFRLDGTGKTATVRLRPIEVARIDGTTLVLRSGLRAGERIVSEGAYFLQDGENVRVLD